MNCAMNLQELCWGEQGMQDSQGKSWQEQNTSGNPRVFNGKTNQGDLLQHKSQVTEKASQCTPNMGDSSALAARSHQPEPVPGWGCVLRAGVPPKSVSPWTLSSSASLPSPNSRRGCRSPAQLANCKGLS